MSIIFLFLLFFASPLILSIGQVIFPKTLPAVTPYTIHITFMYYPCIPQLLPFGLFPFKNHGLGGFNSK